MLAFLAAIPRDADQSVLLDSKCNNFPNYLNRVIVTVNQPNYTFKACLKLHSILISQCRVTSFAGFHLGVKEHAWAGITHCHA